MNRKTHFACNLATVVVLKLKDTSWSQTVMYIVNVAMSGKGANESL